ncbi:hypothetical protein QYE76_061318 [Lolium multiflorum]|uniref:Retrotransposon gag domain-containing protein n=1 Tax=Lolium multiflorum TaxID=4521 RepID=A0AAD8S236_LOLMU|nr:hypothetical protein QYE76_061318 [Lolium multiflorum]
MVGTAGSGTLGRFGRDGIGGSATGSLGTSGMDGIGRLGTPGTDGRGNVGTPGTVGNVGVAAPGTEGRGTVGTVGTVGTTAPGTDGSGTVGTPGTVGTTAPGAGSGTVGTVGRAGTVGTAGTTVPGSVGTAGTVGTVGTTVPGTVGRVGTVGTTAPGTAGIPGTVGKVGSVGSGRAGMSARRRAARHLQPPPFRSMIAMTSTTVTKLDVEAMVVRARPLLTSTTEDLTKGYSRLCGRRTRERKELSGGQESALPEGEIDAIAIVIELDIISIIIIIIISTIYTAITTAAPRHRCISMNEVRKKLFTISLSGKAAHWYKLLKNGDSIDWEDIVPLFYSKFYPPSEIHKDRNRIYNFWPHDGESIAQAWGRLKSLMLKCPIYELPGNVIIDNFYARLSFQDKTLLDTSCSGSFTRNKEEFKRDLLNRIQENNEGWENDKDRESGIIYDYKCIEAFMDTDKFRNMSATYGLDSQVVANLYKAFASHYELPKKNFDKYHEPYKDKVDSSVNKCVVIETDNVIPEAYIEKTPFPAKMKEYSVISSAVNKSEKKPKEPEEQIKIELAVAIVKDLVTENVEDGHIIFCEDASNIVSHPNKPKQVSVPMLSVRIGDHCYYGLCDIGASVSAIPYELYTEIMHEIGSCELEDIDVVIHLANRETISPIGIVRDVEVLCDLLRSRSTMVSNNKDKGPWKEEMDERINKEKEKIASAKGEWEATKSKPILVGSVNTGRSFSHNLQGALPPALDLDSFPCVEEAIRVADEFCDQYRALKREVEILREENQRLRRMLEYYSIPSTRPSRHIRITMSLFKF